MIEYKKQANHINEWKLVRVNWRKSIAGAPQAGLPQAPPQVVASLPQAPPPSHLSQHPMMIDGRPPMMMTPHELEIRMQMEFLSWFLHFLRKLIFPV